LPLVNLLSHGLHIGLRDGMSASGSRTLAVSRRQRRERSGRCWRSAPVPGSVRRVA